MSDTETVVNPELAEAAAALPDATPATDDKAEKAPKVVKQPEPCACSRFLLADEKDLKEGEQPPLFNTDCKSTTMRVFAQGHDARLVSFLVQGEADGLTTLENRNGVHVRYDSAAHAASSISEALGAKAAAASERLKAAAGEKAEREAARTATREAKAAERAAAKEVRAKEAAARKAAKPAKAAAPREVAAKVVKGSEEGGNTAPAEGFVKIKVGRGEYDAIESDADDGQGGTKKVFTFRNLRGEEETRDADTVRVLVSK